MPDPQQQQGPPAALPSLGQLVPSLGQGGGAQGAQLQQPQQPQQAAQTPSQAQPPAQAQSTASAQPTAPPADSVPIFSPEGQLFHVPKDKVNDALDPNKGAGQRALPVTYQGQSHLVPESKYQAALEHGGAADTQQLTANPQSEGLYSMVDAQGNRHQVPFSQVRTAQSMQYALLPADQDQYKKDKLAADSGPSLYDRVMQHLQPTSNAPTTIEGPDGKPMQVKGLSVSPLTNTDKAAARVLVGIPGYIKDLSSAAKDSFTQGDPTPVLNMLDPMPMMQGIKDQFTSDWQKDPQLAVQNLSGTLAGLYIAGRAGKVAGGVGESVAGATIGKIADLGENVKNTASTVTGGEAALRKAATDYTQDVQQTALDRANELQRSADAKQDLADKAGRINAASQTEYDKDVAATTQAQQDLAAKAQRINEAKRQVYDQQVIEKNRKAAEDHAQAVQAVQDHNNQVKSDWQADVQRTQQENEGLEQTLAMHEDTRQQFDEQTQALKERQDALDAKALASVNAQWNDLREKITEPVDLDPVKAAIKRVEQKMTPESVSQFRQIMHTGSEAAEVDTLRQKIVAQTPGLPSVQEGNSFRPPTYEELSPELQKAIDGVVNNQAAVEGIDPEATDDVSFGKLHSWVTELGHKIYRGSYDIPGNIKSGLRDVYTAAKKAEDASARDAGAADDLTDARAATRDYKQAFGIPDKSRPTVDSQLLQKTNPELFAKQARQQQIDAVAKYDPMIKDAYDELDRVKSLHESLTDPDQLRKKIQQIPPEPVEKYKDAPVPPKVTLPKAPQPYEQTEGYRSAAKAAGKPVELPKPYEQTEGYLSAAKKAEAKEIPSPEPLNVTAIKRASVQAAVDRWQQLDKWQIKALGSALGMTPLAFFGFGPHAAEAVGVGHLFAVMAPKVFASILDKPRFKEWISNGPTARDLATMQKIPNADLVRLKDGMTGQVVNLAQAGEHFDMSPKTARFLGPQRTERIIQAMAGGLGGATVGRQAAQSTAQAAAALPQAAQSQPAQPQQPPSQTSAAGVSPQ